MYCRHCGNQLDDRAVMCPKCGCGTSQSAVTKQNSTESQNNPFALTGFVLALAGSVLSFFFLLVNVTALYLLFLVGVIAGLVFSIIGLTSAKKYAGKGKGFGIAGIVIASCYIAGMIILFIISTLLVYSFLFFLAILFSAA